MKKLIGKMNSQKFVNGTLNFFKDERGQSTTEYILMLAVVVMIAMKFKSTFLGQMDGIVKGVSGNIEKVVSETQ